MDLEDYRDIVRFLQSPTLKRVWPSSILDRNTKSNYRKKVKPYLLEDGTLFYNHKVHGPLRIVKPDEVEVILKSCHENPMGGHQGIRRTWQKIKTRYHWPAMQKDVKEYVAACDACQRQNRLFKTPSVLHPIPVKNKAFSMLGMDLVGPLRQTSKGNTYIAVLTDYLTKWPEVKAIPSKEASEIASFIIDTVCRHGCPEVILTDRGREFCNELNDKLCRSLSIERRVTTAYHPQTNGLTERFNQTLCHALVKYVNSTQDDWDAYLQQIAFAARTCVQASTKETPFFLTYGRQAVLPVQLDIPTTLATDDPVIKEDEFQELLNDRAASFAELLNLQNIAKDRITESQKKQKIYYDKKNTGTEHKVGDKVLIRNKKRLNRKGDKLQAKWVGPFVVSTCIGKGVYKVEGRNSKLNIKDTKAYREPAKPAFTIPDKDVLKKKTQRDGTIKKKVTKRMTKMQTTREKRQRKSTVNTRTNLKELPSTKRKNKRKTSTQTDQLLSPTPPKESAATITKGSAKPTPKGIQNYITSMDSSTKLRIYETCTKTPFQQPVNPTNDAIANSPVLSIIMEANSRFEEDVEVCQNSLLSWYMTEKLSMDLVDSLDAFMLASALVTTSFHDKIAIDDILKTVQNVPTSTLSSDSPCKILKKTTKMTIGNTTLDRADLCTLYPNKWLNDQVIHAYLGLLKSECNAVTKMGCYVLPCFLASKWETGKYNAWLYPKVPLESYQTVFLPICHQHHWFLLVANMETATISVLDSLPNEGRLQKSSEHWRCFMKARGDRRMWKIKEIYCNKQTDGNSCGVFVLMNAEAILQQLSPIVMRQCHVPFFRRYALKRLLRNPSGATETACDLPFCSNTDRNLRRNQCERCDKWAHPKCLGLFSDQMKSPCVFC